jgi:hypothetical protein
MEISKTHGYLSHSYNVANQKNSILFSGNLESLILKWDSCTRVSPIWRLFPDDGSLDIAFERQSKVAILGPVNPFILDAELGLFQEDNLACWCSLGILNCIIVYKDDAITNKLLRWSEERRLKIEVWNLGENREVESSIQREFREDIADPEWRSDLSRLMSIKSTPSVDLALSEFGPLMASTMSRLEIYIPELVSRYKSLIGYVEEIVLGNGAAQNLLEESIVAASITTLNAGLSRFSSQSLSGIIPISHTESHFWVHSLFGIGVAGLGLANLVHFISSKIGSAFIPDRFLMHLDNAKKIPNLKLLHSNDQFWKTSYIDSQVVEMSIEELQPDITFFSGRDGFKAHLNNISVPLTTIFSASSEKWSLLTVTHEISHKIIKAILSVVFPIDEPCEKPMIGKQDAQNLYIGEDSPSNWLDAIRVWIWEAVACIDAVNQKQHSESNPDEIEVPVGLLDAINTWAGEVEEILVHVFDFMYFYRSEDESYLRDIWLTWSVIPNITNRVPEYVVRSVCALLSKNTHRECSDAINVSIDKVQARLAAILQEDAQMPYISQALDYIHNSKNQLYKLVEARYELVAFVKTFLYSEKAATELWMETRAINAEAGRLRYPKKVGVIDDTLIENPLSFLSSYCKEKKIVESHAAWIYYNLAFNLRVKNG